MLTELSVTLGRSKPFQTFVERLLFFGFKTTERRERLSFYISRIGVYNHSVNILRIP